MFIFLRTVFAPSLLSSSSLLMTIGGIIDTVEIARLDAKYLLVLTTVIQYTYGHSLCNSS